MEGYHHNDFYYADGDGSGWGWGWIIGIVILLIIIGIVFFFFFRNNNVVTPTVVTPVWMFTGSGSTSTSFVADNFTIFVATPTTPMTLTIVSPAGDPTGRQFIIDNSGGTATVTLAGVTVVPDSTLMSNVIAPRRVALFIWKSPNTILRVNQQ